MMFPGTRDEIKRITKHRLVDYVEKIVYALDKMPYVLVKIVNVWADTGYA